MPQAASTDPPTTPLFHKLHLFYHRTLSPYLAQIFMACQIQQHLGLAPPQTDIPGPSEPRAPTKETIPIEETITADVPPQAIHETAPEPSCPPENPVP
ncbi:hypothetical protein CK203_112874 [Vitis vinifera]|uniref:Uncharacterized protein n=1 Tax=Vitis vinifera TaxID=29760 RepID=A0A438CV19_VITVI|nr:hypothetical protein CK203_112874 [Vitis vinifera]